MTAPQNIDPAAARAEADVLHWLTNDTRDQRFIDNIFAEMCIRLQQADIPLKRATLHVVINHPQWLAASEAYEAAQTCHPRACPEDP